MRMSACRVFLSIVAALLLLLPTSTHAALPRALSATVERVSDGDTLVAIAANQTKLRIRLLGIDAPEIPHGRTPGQPFGEEARECLDHLIGGKTVHVDAYGPDRYKRVLDVIWDEQINVNLLMVAMGYAEVYWGVPCQANCRELEQRGPRPGGNRVGMWVQGEKYESPAAVKSPSSRPRIKMKAARGNPPAASSRRISDSYSGDASETMRVGVSTDRTAGSE